MKTVSAIFITLMIASCSMFISAPVGVKSKNYSFSFNESHWEQIDPDTSDYAYVNKQTNSVIIANSICKKYESTSLKNLTTNILSGIHDLKVETHNKHSLSSRDSIRTYARGKLDGVQVHLIVQTIKKNRCIYDFALISQSEKKRDDDQEYFLSLLKSLKIK